MSNYNLVMSEEFFGAVRRGAFDHWQGEIVPVRGPDKRIIGEATIVSVDHRENGSVYVVVSSEINLDYRSAEHIAGLMCDRSSMSFQPIQQKPPVKLPHQPMRDDDVARWLKAKRDEDGYKSTTYWEINELLDEYRARADYGFTLDHDMSELEGRW
jgi:hypothetical protein